MSEVFYKGFGTSALDSKGRFVMPANFRADLRKSCVVETRIQLRYEDNVPYLSVFGDAELAEFRRDSEERTRISRDRGQDFDRVEYDVARSVGTEEVTLDGGGRFAIDRDVRESVGIVDGIVVVGADRFIQLWNPVVYLEKGTRNSVTEKRVRRFMAELEEKRKARAK